jgi:hypothetical protein
MVGTPGTIPKLRELMEKGTPERTMREDYATTPLVSRPLGRMADPALEKKVSGREPPMAVPV